MNHQHPQPQPLAQVGTAYDLQRIAEAASRKQRDEGPRIAAAPQSPVEAAFSKMDETLSALRNVVQRLTGRLDSVLSRTGSGANGTSGEAPVNTIAPLVEAMGQRNAQISGHVAALEELERRLAL